MIDKLAELRQEYSRHRLSKSDVSADPFEQFRIWFDEAAAAEIEEPNAMHLGTCSAEGVPSGRTVLLKGFDHSGFTFFTNYQSRKGRELAANPHCYLHFFWKELERQVFLSGSAARVSEQESDEYFAQRPYESQLGAWTSEQSSVVGSREILERRFDELRGEYAEGDVPRPEFWGGYRVTPAVFEFWQGRPNRLHDRIQYSRSENEWRISRLSP